MGLGEDGKEEKGKHQSDYQAKPALLAVFNKHIDAKAREKDHYGREDIINSGD